MSTSVKLNILLLIAIANLLNACAQRGAPTGGPMDTIPPTLVTSLPINKEIYYKSKEIELTFNEPVNGDNVQSELIITPRDEEHQFYKSRAVKNKLILTFNEPLEENTTYALNFRDGIKDMTEGNIAEGVRIAFSTGPYLDSLQVKGKIKNLLTNQPIKDAIISLYPEGDTLDIFNSEPNYFTLSGEDGSYLLDNVKDGNYRIYAYHNKNKNLTSNPATDPYNFKARTIELQGESDAVDFGLVHNDISDLELLYYRPSGKYFEIRMDKDLLNYSITPKDTETQLYSNLEENRTIIFYNTEQLEEADSIAISLHAVDSAFNELNQDLYVKFVESRQPYTDFTQTANSPESQIIDTIKLTYQFNKPIKTVNPDSLYIQYDSLVIDKIDVDKEIVWNDQRDQLTITKYVDKSRVQTEEDEAEEDEQDITAPVEEADLTVDKAVDKSEQGEQRLSRRERREAREREQDKPQKISYVDRVRLYNAAGSFISVENDSSQLVDNFYTIKNPRDFGIIRGTINTDYQHFYIQLLDEKYEVLDQKIDIKDYEFNYVTPGTYFIRVLVDTNNSGKWDKGDVRKNEESDKVYFIENPITIRANWEILDQNLSF